MHQADVNICIGPDIDNYSRSGCGDDVPNPKGQIYSV